MNGFSYFLHLQDLLWPKKKISFAKWQQVQYFLFKKLVLWLTDTRPNYLLEKKLALLDYDFLYIPPNLSHWQSCWLALALVNQSPWLKVQFAKKKLFPGKNGSWNSHLKIPRKWPNFRKTHKLTKCVGKRLSQKSLFQCFEKTRSKIEGLSNNGLFYTQQPFGLRRIAFDSSSECPQFYSLRHKKSKKEDFSNRFRKLFASTI